VRRENPDEIRHASGEKIQGCTCLWISIKVFNYRYRQINVADVQHLQKFAKPQLLIFVPRAGRIIRRSGGVRNERARETTET
jgi:hypothetical protein